MFREVWLLRLDFVIEECLEIFTRMAVEQNCYFSRTYTSRLLKFIEEEKLAGCVYPMKKKSLGHLSSLHSL